MRAEPSATFVYVKAVVYAETWKFINTDPGPPLVSPKMMSNCLRESISLNTTDTIIKGINIGSVSVLNVNHREAPSTIAASKGGAGIDRRPASRSNAINGVNIQTSIITTENMAEFAAEAH